MLDLKVTKCSAGALAILTFLATSEAHAQTIVQGYGVLGKGRYSNHVTSGSIGTLAAGGEVLIAGWLGGGAEVGFEAYGSTLSLDGLVQLQHARRRFVPFIRAGFTHSNGEYSNTYSGPNVGAGVNLWLRPRAGLRVEYVHVVRTLSGFPAWTEKDDFVRVGVSFR